MVGLSQTCTIFILWKRGSGRGKMITLPNGVKIFNATADTLIFDRYDWLATIRVPVDQTIGAGRGRTRVYEYPYHPPSGYGRYVFIKEVYDGDKEGRELLDKIAWGVVVVGSEIAARAYPGRVVVPVPCVGYEDKTPMEMRYQADVFMVFD